MLTASVTSDAMSAGSTSRENAAASCRTSFFVIADSENTGFVDRVSDLLSGAIEYFR